MQRTAVLLINLGAPDSLDAVQPFLQELFSDRDIIQMPFQKFLSSLISITRATKVKKHYEMIGGKSPLIDITKAQAVALERELGENFKVYVGMRYWRPSIRNAIGEINKGKIKNLILLPLFPQYSRVTSGSCINELKRVLEGTDIRLNIIENFYENPLYLDALAEKIEEGLSHFQVRENVQVIFSAHALPEKMVIEGDPYIDQVKNTINGLLSRSGHLQWRLAFQSRTGPVKWTGPSVEEVIKEVAGEKQDILFVPLSFVSDNIEILYEVDVVYKRLAESKGVANFQRTPSLNTSTKFINALAQLVNENAKF